MQHLCTFVRNALADLKILYPLGMLLYFAKGGDKKQHWSQKLLVTKRLEVEEVTSYRVIDFLVYFWETFGAQEKSGTLKVMCITFIVQYSFNVSNTSVRILLHFVAGDVAHY